MGYKSLFNAVAGKNSLVLGYQLCLTWSLTAYTSLWITCHLSEKTIHYVQAILAKDATISVNRCIWGPDGSILGNFFNSPFSLGCISFSHSLMVFFWELCVVLLLILSFLIYRCCFFETHCPDIYIQFRGRIKTAFRSNLRHVIIVFFC